MSRRSSSSLRTPETDVYQTITDRIVAAVEANPETAKLPWHRSGLATLLPVNALTTNAYRGINILSLWCDAQEKNFSYAVWATYKQWQELGAQVRKGERSSTIVFYKEYEVAPEPDDPDDKGKRFVAKASHVFNAGQVDGYAPVEPPPPLPPIERNAAAEAFVAATGAVVTIGGENAFYRHATDSIHMPDPDRFREPDADVRSADWFSVLSHELGHWSGISTRLDRQFGKRFGDQAYCAEELVAELTSCFAMARLGISAEPRADHASYIAHYLTLMRSDRRAIFTAAAKAAEATDYLWNFSHPKESTPTNESNDHGR